MDILKEIKKFNKFARVGSEGLTSDIIWYVDTGSYMFNALLSGSLFGGFPGNRIVGFAGPQASGKTLMTLFIIKNFLELNPKYICIYYDTEGAVEKNQLLDLKIDTDRFWHIPIGSLEDLRIQTVKTVDLINKKKEENGDELEEKYFFVVDSIGMPASEKELSNALEGKTAIELKRPQILKSIFRCLTMDLSLLQMPMITTTHTYESMDMYKPKGISGGSGLMFAGSIIIEMSPSKDRDKDKQVRGTILKCTTRKSRTTKPNRSITMKLDFINGLDRYYGLIDFALDVGFLKKDGKKILFPSGSRYFRGEIEDKPADFFTEEVLKSLNEKAKEYFCYGVGDGLVTAVDEDDICTEDDLVSNVEDLKIAD